MIYRPVMKKTYCHPKYFDITPPTGKTNTIPNKQPLLGTANIVVLSSGGLQTPTPPTIEGIIAPCVTKSKIHEMIARNDTSKKAL